MGRTRGEEEGGVRAGQEEGREELGRMRGRGRVGGGKEERKRKSWVMRGEGGGAVGG